MSETNQEPCLYCSAAPGEPHQKSCTVFGGDGGDDEPRSLSDRRRDLLLDLANNFSELGTLCTNIGNLLEEGADLIDDDDDDDDDDDEPEAGPLIMPCTLAEIEPGVWGCELAPSRFTYYTLRRLVLAFPPKSIGHTTILEATIGTEPIHETYPVSAMAVPGIGFPLPRKRWNMGEAIRFKFKYELDSPVTKAIVLVETPHQ